jgi:hypothetical protein
MVGNQWPTKQSFKRFKFEMKSLDKGRRFDFDVKISEKGNIFTEQLIPIETLSLYLNLLF